MKAILCAGIWISLLLVGCGTGPNTSDVSHDRKFLTNDSAKTWSMTKIVIGSKLQKLYPGLEALTKTYHADGTWKDNLGNEGKWSIEEGRYFLEEQTVKVSPLKPTAPKTKTAVRIVSLRNELLILEFDNLDVGTSDKGFGMVYLEPVRQ